MLEQDFVLFFITTGEHLVLLDVSNYYPLLQKRPVMLLLTFSLKCSWSFKAETSSVACCYVMKQNLIVREDVFHLVFNRWMTNCSKWMLCSVNYRAVNSAPAAFILSAAISEDNENEFDWRHLWPSLNRSHHSVDCCHWKCSTELHYLWALKANQTCLLADARDWAAGNYRDGQDSNKLSVTKRSFVFSDTALVFVCQVLKRGHNQK